MSATVSYVYKHDKRLDGCVFFRVLWALPVETTPAGLRGSVARMSYDLEELRTGIVEMFDDVVTLSPYREDLGVLHVAQSLRIRPFTDEELLKEVRHARVSAPERIGVGRGTGTVEHWRHILESIARKGLCVCLACGARAPEHRCPG